ncbi:MAG: ATP-binding protein [Defluviitaleaceae bacterium]|nr:ATP-binding protein [Defluviitaleaceae bacterium]
MFLILTSLCGVSGSYLYIKSYLRFILFVNVLLFISIVMLQLPIEGVAIDNENIYTKWFLMMFCVLSLYIALVHVTKKHEENTNAMGYFITMLDATPNIVAVVDMNNRVNYISKELCKLAKLENIDFAKNRPLLDLFGNSEISDMIADILDTVGDSENTVKVEIDGEDRYLKISCVRLGRKKGKFINISEVTPIMQARIEAEHASRAKSDFLATISHEIRTPMNAIIGIAQIQLQNEDLPDEFAAALDKIWHASDSLLGIINDVLDMSKVEAERLELSPANYDVPSLISDVVQLNIIKIASKPVEFVLDVDENLPSRFFGDELRIKQILNNFLSNGMKYTARGSVHLSVSHSDHGEFAMLKFVIKDTGQGIKSQDVEKLFSKYQRFNSEENRNIEGTGLGLFITYKLVEMMQGNIIVESEFGKGSTFTVEIKQKTAECPVIGAELSNKLCSFTFADKRKRTKAMIANYTPMPYGKVLIVDDIETNLYVAKGLLVPYDLNTETVDSGFAAIDFIKNGKSYDIIFMDHMMPGIDGVETTKRLRELGYTNAIVALTANALTDNDEMFAQNGFDGFLSKPIDVRNLDVVLNKFICDMHPEESVKYKPIIAERRKIRRDNNIVERSPELIKVFCKDAKKAITVLRKALLNKDIASFTITTHAMKTALSNIGENGKSILASKLETAGKENDWGFIVFNTERFVQLLEELIKEMDVLEVFENEPNSDLQEDMLYLEEQLKLIKIACDDYDDTAVYNVIDRLRGKPWRSEICTLIDNMYDMLFLHSDFDGVGSAAQDHYERE